MKTKLFMMVIVAMLITSFSYALEKGKIAPSTVPKSSAPVPTIPPAPTNLVATADTAGHVKLTWSYNAADAKNLKNFMVERRPETGGSYAQIMTVWANPPFACPDEDPKLKPGAKYFYRIRAYNGSFYSDYSNEYPATIWSNAPSPPTMMKAEYANLVNGIKLVWQDAQKETKYILYRYEPGKGKQNIAELPANSTQYVDKKDLKAEVEYIYTLTAYNTDGEASGQCKVTIPGLPAMPTYFHATPSGCCSSTTMELNWTDNSNNEDGFWIARRPSYQGNYPSTPQIKLGPNVTQYHDTGLEPETTYYYIITSIRGNQGPPPPYPEAHAMTNPYPPENLQATALSSSEIKLTWMNRSKVAETLIIQRKTGSSGTFEQVFQKYSPVDITTYTDKGLKPGTTYSYRMVVFISAFNGSDFSKEVSATTPAAP
jgi:fibronectin type 3 domain-containing protein